MLIYNYLNSLILIFFSILLKDFLIIPTLILNLIAVFFSFINFKPSKIIRNVVSIILLISYWVSFNKVFDPEVGLNFLNSVMVLKILERENSRDDYMIFFGMILLIFSGSLFEKNLFYLIFLTISFLFLIKKFYFQINYSINFKKMFLGLVILIPLVLILFFAFPRSISPIEFRRTNIEEGEIGYSPVVEISKFSQLMTTNAGALKVVIQGNGVISKGPFYWRGNSVSLTNGWDWSLHSSDQFNDIKNISDLKIKNSFIIQNVKLLFQSDFNFALSTPEFLDVRGDLFQISNNKSILNKKYRQSKRYKVWSDPGTKDSSIENKRQYLRSGLSQVEREWIKNQFKSSQPQELINQIKDYFIKNKFSYTLNPGSIQSFYEFMTLIKKGVCSHFSSSLALILREKKIPARLVSGFLGGQYNPYGGFFVVKQNDAHVWVEYFDQGEWKMLDPTLWIEPQRSTITSEEFFEKIVPGSFIFGKKNWPFLTHFEEIKLWLTQWDFKFYQWLEEIDYDQQERLINFFGIKRNWLYFMFFLTLIIFFWAFLNLQKSTISKADLLWSLFFKKFKKKFPDIESYHFAEIKKYTDQDPKMRMILKKVETFCYKNEGNYKEIKNELIKLD